MEKMDVAHHLKLCYYTYFCVALIKIPSEKEVLLLYCKIAIWLYKVYDQKWADWMEWILLLRTVMRLLYVIEHLWC